MSMDDLISRQAAIEALQNVSEHYTEKGRNWHPHVNFMIEAIEDLPSAQPDLLDGLKIIEQFLQSCKDSLTYEIVAPNGMKLHTDWGYFEEGLEELRRYAERREE